jgi:CsoR family transcriptional regulator, copper-sensing transcriptional repressor
MANERARVGDGRMAHHSAETKAGLIRRLRRIEGQVRGIARLIKEDTYCDDVLNQIASVESALNGVRKQLLEAHIRGCVVEQITSGRHSVIDELMVTIGRMTR